MLDDADISHLLADGYIYKFIFLYERIYYACLYRFK